MAKPAKNRKAVSRPTDYINGVAVAPVPPRDPMAFDLNDLLPLPGHHSAGMVTNGRPLGRPKGEAGRRETEARYERFFHELTCAKTIKAALIASELTWGAIQSRVATNREFAERYHASRQIGADIWADRAVMVSRRRPHDQVDATMYRLQAEVCKWRASVQGPRNWSERAQMAPPTTNIAISTGTLHLDLLRQRAATDYDPSPLAIPAEIRDVDG